MKNEEVDSAITFHFHRISAAMERSQLKDLRLLDLNTSRWRVLSCLEQKGDCTIGELAKVMVVQQPVVSRVITEMERDGLLRRREGKKDHRYVKVSVTSSGWALFRKANPLIMKHREALNRTLSAADKNRLMKMLRRMEENLGISQL